MTTYSRPVDMLVWSITDDKPHVEQCDGYDLLKSWYDGRNRAIIQPLRYRRNEATGKVLPGGVMETVGVSYAIDASHPLCPGL
jgi:hypothetical protein